MSPAPTPRLFAIASAIALAAAGLDLSSLPEFLRDASLHVFPELKQIGVDVWNHPEPGRSQVFAHDRATAHLSHPTGRWNVTLHAYGQPTAWTAQFENLTPNSTDPLPTIGFISEMDALPGVGHACGHNLILLSGIAAATLTRNALIHFNIPGRVTLIGTPDEEQTGGKKRLLDAGAFKDGDVWLMAHPTVANLLSPMQARHTASLRITGQTHHMAVHRAFDQFVAIADLDAQVTSHGPGTASSLTPVEYVGVSNVIQTTISLGVAGPAVRVARAIDRVKTDPAYMLVTCTLHLDLDGNVVTCIGPGGHASGGTKGPLRFVIELFRILSQQQQQPPSSSLATAITSTPPHALTPAFTFYLPGNTSVTELDVSVSVRTRYDTDLPALEAALERVTSADSLSWDVKYRNLEVSPYLGTRMIDIMKQPEINEAWSVTSTAPAATDLGWVQDPIVDTRTNALISEAVPALHANFGICPSHPPHMASPRPQSPLCPFNHEAAFHELAGSALAYAATERVARGLAQLAVELVADPARMAQARALVRPAKEQEGGTAAMVAT